MKMELERGEMSERLLVAMETVTMVWMAAVVAAGLIYWFMWVMGAAEVKGKQAVDLKMGSITRDKVQHKYWQYWSFFRSPKETAEASSENVPAIATRSGANIVGITINEYQVGRACAHNKKSCLDALCEVVCGNFLKMPFPDSSFDGAYSIKATCHAPHLEDVYAEIFRILKPRALTGAVPCQRCRPR